MANFTPQQIEEFLQEFFDVVGTRQYIGARYIPIFGRPGESSIEWDNTAPYEPLTIVTYQGNSYTSRQYVPTGVDIANTDYWANTGNYNSQIEQYRQEVVQLGNEWTDWKSDTESDIQQWEDDAEQQINTALSQYNNVIPVSSFSSENTVKDYIDNRNNGLPWAGRNVLCITDSWGTEGLYGVTKCWMRMACETLGGNYIDLHQGSTGFIQPETETDGRKNFVDRLTDYINSHTVAELATIDYVIVCGSSNDAVRPDLGSAIQAAVNSLITLILQNMPNAYIYMVPQIASPNMMTCSITTTFNVWNYVSANVSVCALIYNWDPYRVAWVMQSPYWLFTLRESLFDIMNADFVHPKQVGHNRIAKCFVNYVMGVPFSFVAGNMTDHLRLGSGTDNVTAFTSQVLHYSYTGLHITDSSIFIKIQTSFSMNILQSTDAILGIAIDRFIPIVSDTWVYGTRGSYTNAGIGILMGSQTGKVIPVLPSVYSTLNSGTFQSDNDALSPCFLAFSAPAAIASLFPNDTDLRIVASIELPINYPIVR